MVRRSFLLDTHAVHVLEVEKLPLYHKDPFDRMLIAQARVEKLILLTNDIKIKKYELKLL